MVDVVTIAYLPYFYVIGVLKSLLRSATYPGEDWRQVNGEFIRDLLSGVAGGGPGPWFVYHLNANTDRLLYECTGPTVTAPCLRRILLALPVG
jgi:hypothetical protein